MMKAPSLLLALLGLAMPLMGADLQSLRQSLSLHASFDKGLNADFSRGDKRCVMRKGKDWVDCQLNEEVKLVPGGKFGQCLHFPQKGKTNPSFLGAGVLGYNAKSWSNTVSIWLSLTADEDLQPGYCDPLQIVGNDSKKGFIFLEFSKDETPRFFRFAVRPLAHIWNPTDVSWADIPFEKRPMVQLRGPVFSRERWTHVAFTLERLNDTPAAKPRASLYLDGKAVGSIDNWDLRFEWDPASVAMVLGASYVGKQDDLAVFDRCLNAAEIAELHALPQGVGSLLEGTGAKR